MVATKVRRALPRIFDRFFVSFFVYFLAKPALKTSKLVLKHPNRHSKKRGTRLQPALKRPNRRLTEGLGELCFKLDKLIRERF